MAPPSEHDERQDDGEDRPVDEEPGHAGGLGFWAEAGRRGGAGADSGTGLTTVPGRAFCTPSTTTRFAGLRALGR